MKQKKLSLNNLKVKSFVTRIDDSNVNTVKGGAPTDHCQSDGGCGMTNNCATIDGWGDCQWHTAQAHNCSLDVCYSNYCNSTECNGPASDRCMV